MLVKKLWWMLGLGMIVAGCVPLSTYQDMQNQNDALKQAAERNRGQAEDEAERSTDLALQNHNLKIDKEDLLKEGRDRDAFYDSVTHDLRQQVGDGRLKISRFREMLTLDVADEILFDSAKADLKPEGKEVLLQVGKALSKTDKTIRVVGHTDNQALAPGAGFASNWELSTARATTVVRFLQDQCNIDPRLLLAAGRGEWMPLTTNSTPEGRQRNRRITITLIDANLLDGSEGSVPPAVAP
jgi:flagellar motor protein MotB